MAALIGCIYALAQFAQNSEFTAMRAAGMSRQLALRGVLVLGVLLAVLTAVAGEWIAPMAEQRAQQLRMDVLGKGSGVGVDAEGRIAGQVKIPPESPVGIHPVVVQTVNPGYAEILDFKISPKLPFTGVNAYHIARVIEIGRASCRERV